MDWLIPTLEIDARRLGRDALRLLVIVFLLPNLAFLVGDLVWGLKRPPVNLDYAWLLLFAPWLGAMGTGLAVGCVMLLDLLVAMSYRFHGDAAALLDASVFIRNLSPGPAASIALVLLVLTLACSFAVRSGLRHNRRRLGANVAALFGAAAIWLSTDSLAAKPSRAVVLDAVVENVVDRTVAADSWKRSYGVVDYHMPSATAPLFDALRERRPLPRRISLTLVETLGAVRNPELMNAFLAPLRDPALRAAYDVVEGRVQTRGPTIMGEIRELCHARVRSVLPDPQRLPRQQCLPALLGRRGYRSVGIHGYDATMYRRNTWWPAVGFDSTVFQPDIARTLGNIGTCGGLFEGTCDGDAVHIVERELAAARGPTLVYWLTLNAHWPYTLPDSVPPPRACLTTGARVPGSGACALLYYNHIVLEGLRRVALDMRNDTVGFLIVGDHGDAYGDGSVIQPDSVAYVFLWPREVPLHSRP